MESIFCCLALGSHGFFIIVITMVGNFLYLLNVVEYIGIYVYPNLLTQLQLQAWKFLLFNSINSTQLVMR